MPSGAPPKDQALATLARGATIGRYVVLGLVGRGGMGEVYAAYDPELDRKVAVKLLRIKRGAGVSQAEGRQRTLREAQAIARLSHPNVVVVFDVGTYEDQVFIAMEFVEGNTATYWLQAAERSWPDILNVFLAAGRGLAAAHEKGLVHRDFKPDNVMVGRDNQVRVMDFGLARQVTEKTTVTAVADRAVERPAATTEERTTPTQRIPAPVAEHAAGIDFDSASTIVIGAPPGAGGVSPTETQSAPAGMFEVQLTRTGAMMGTPAYMAPEQFLGAATDARTDQFSFCVALYEALYGQRPFGGNTMFALTSNVVQGKVREAPPESNVPPWIRRILLRGLRPTVSERFASMNELLEAFAKDPAVKRRKAVAAGLAAALAVGLVVGGRQVMPDRRAVCGGGPAKLAGVWELTRPGQTSSALARQTRIRKAFLHTGKGYASNVYNTVDRVLTTYAESWAAMYQEACEATQVRGEQSAEVLDLRMSCLQERLGGMRALTDLFAEATGDVVENAVNAANALGSLDRCADVPLLRSVVRPPEDPSTRARVADLRRRLAGLKARYDAGRWKEVMQEAPVLVAEARVIGYQPLVAETLAQSGIALLKSNDSKAAERAFVEAFWAADGSRHDEVRAEVASQLVYVFGFQEGHYDEAERWSKTAEAVLQRIGGHELLRAWLLNNTGAALYMRGERQAALRVQQEGMALKEKALGREHPDVGVSEGNLAIALAELALNQEALTHVDRSIMLLENGLGAGHPELATQLSNRGEILDALGRHREARESFERARVIWERELGLDDRNLAYALTGIGGSYLAEGDPGSALAPLERALKIREAHEIDWSRRAETRFALARALWESNRDRGRARLLAEQAKEGYAKLSGGSRMETKLAEVEDWLRGHGSS
jgi:serine/threonine protein kinase/tetratricopeptide (TPR) repeat protein